MKFYCHLVQITRIIAKKKKKITNPEWETRITKTLFNPKSNTIDFSFHPKDEVRIHFC